jgi:competence ComEA-like helix-hairpin-helix protein
LWEAFAVTQGNPRPDVVEKMLEGLGVDNRHPRMDLALGGGYAAVRLALDLFIDVRNECAHTGSATKIPSTSDLRSYCDTIERIAAAVVQVLEGRMAEAPFGVDINSASALELRRIPRMGSSRIAALIQHRSQTGRFARIEDVGQVPGFGPRFIQHLRLYAHV